MYTVSYRVLKMLTLSIFLNYRYLLLTAAPRYNHEMMTACSIYAQNNENNSIINNSADLYIKNKDILFI